MKIGVQIVVAVTAWLAVGGLLLLKTILVDRAELDFEQLQRYEALAQGPIKTGIRVAVSDEAIPDIARASELVLNRQLADLGSAFAFVVSPQCTRDAELCIETRLGEEDTLELDSGKRNLHISYTPETMANGRVPEAVAMLLLDHIYKHEVSPNSAHTEHEEVTVSYAPEYQLTFNLFSEGGALLNWDVAAAINKKLGPLLASLNHAVAPFTIDTQTGLYAKMGTEPHATEQENDVRVLERSQLSTFVDFAEWKLASSLPYPTLNFVFYVPESPLKIRDTVKPLPQFIIPQWGGVVIGDPQVGEHTFSEDELAPVLDVFARQLLVLLGLREPTDQDKPSHGSPEIMLARLSRQNARRGLIGAASSLGSLRRLAASMPNIAIPQQVSQRAKETMRELDDGMQFLAEGRHAEAAASARLAYTAADRAFFDKHMVAQAYFPDEHKVAVYMPLIGPLLVVVLSGWLRFIKQKKAPTTTSTATLSAEKASDETKLNK